MAVLLVALRAEMTVVLKAGEKVAWMAMTLAVMKAVWDNLTVDKMAYYWEV